MRPPVVYVFPARRSDGGGRGTECYNRREMIDDGPGERESIGSVPSSSPSSYF